MSIGEVVSKAIRSGDSTGVALNAIRGLSKILLVDEEDAFAAGSIHARIRKTQHDFGLADAFVAAAARRLGAKILTGDPHFKDMKEAVLI